VLFPVFGVIRHKATPTRTKLLRGLVRDLPDTAEGARDRALLLVGFAGALMPGRSSG
jgi:hypothetical protein